MILYRPVGLQELELIYDSGMKAFPARLPKQPIFYPVLDLEYARQTASGWNAESGGSAGYVTQFNVEEKYIKKFEKHKVRGSQYQEYWIPSEEMEKFNKHIVGHIKVVEAHFGDAFKGYIPDGSALQGKNAVEQFTELANSFLYKRVDFYREIRRNHKAVFLNYPFWQKYEFKNPGLKENILKAIKEAWFTSFPQIPLPSPLPVQEDIPLEEQADSKAPAKDEDEPIQGEIMTKEESDEYDYSWENPVHEETSYKKQFGSLSKHAQRVDDSDEEDITPEEQVDLDRKHLANSVHEKFPPLKRTYADSLLNPVEEEFTPEEQPDAHAQRLDDSDEDDGTPEEQTPARAQVHAKQLVNSVHEDKTLPIHTTSHAKHVQGVKLGLRGDYHAAIVELSKAVEEDPEDVVAHTSLGVAFHRLGQDDRALASYEMALKIDPIYAEAHYFRANLLYQQGSVREAIAGYTVAMGLKPELIQAYHKPIPEDRLTDYSPSLAEMVWITKPAHRILDLNNRIESNPQPNLFKRRAAEYYRLRNYAQAIADLNSALELQPDDASALHSRGVAYEGLGQNERAQEDYQRAIAINPQLANEYLQRGVTFGQAGSFQQSVDSLTEGIRLAPENPIGYFNRGVSYFQLGDLESAIADFSNVIRLSPTDEAAYYWRGVSYEEAGRQREATADYRQFLALSQDETIRAEVEARLRAWREWKEANRNVGRERSVIPNDRQKAHQVGS
ncbi:MAG TPA: tetratricopeptide repeat protein, partial [Anaerolineales bacterium]|nr:tetratricopeptide repeat protein [Anaerolineales bacterium]